MPLFNKNNTPKDTPATCSSNKLIVQKDGKLYSKRFNDISLDTQLGYQQRNETFIKGNYIDKVFSQAQQIVTIAETSFGTGLNFLLTLQAYQKA